MTDCCKTLMLLVGCVLATACVSKQPSTTKALPVIPTTSPSPPHSSSTKPTVTTEIYHGKGTVTATNPKFPSVEMDHDEIAGLMPAMRMEFFVADVAMLKNLKPGDKIEFTLQNGVGGLKITEIKKL